MKLCRWVGLPQPHPTASLLVFSSLATPSPTQPYLEAVSSVHLERNPYLLAKMMLPAFSCLKPTSRHWKPTPLSPQNLSHHTPPFAFAKACTRGDKSGRAIAVILNDSKKLNVSSPSQRLQLGRMELLFSHLRDWSPDKTQVQCYFATY